MTNVAWDSIDDYNDLNSHSQYEIALKAGYSEKEALGFVHRFSRDNARTPMQWDDSSQAGLDTDKTKVLLSSYEDTKNAQPASIGVLRPYEAVIIQSRAEH